MQLPQAAGCFVPQFCSFADGVVDDKPELQFEFDCLLVFFAKGPYLPYSKFSGSAIELLNAQHAGFHPPAVKPSFVKFQ